MKQCLTLQKEGILSHVDLLFAQSVANEDSPMLLAACLFALARSGHLLLELTEEGIHLAMQQLGIEDASIPALLREGAEKISGTWLRRNGACLYLQKNWVFESKIIADLLRLIAAPVADFLAQPEISSVLNSEQSLAVKRALEHPLSFLTGGPGTGKTFTAAQIVKTFLAQTPQMRVLLTAPTGKAVAQLQAGMRSLISDAVHIQAGTLHSLLGISSRQSSEEAQIPLVADLIIVDECSMVDLYVFSKLLEKVASGTRLVLIGDRNQLPPVEAGSVFADVIASQVFPCTELTQVLRSDCQEILSFAHLIKEGKAEEAIQTAAGADLKRVALDFHAAGLWQQCRHFFPGASLEQIDPLSALSGIKRFCLLSCIRKGPMGADALNRFFLQQSLKGISQEQWWAAPIMITRNNDELDLYNGDQGVLIRQVSAGHLTQLDVKDEAYFLDRSGGYRMVPALALPSFEYCYCLSVHKSQGSEYDEVFILAPEGAESFGREVLYTAITRARSKATLAVSDAVLRAAVTRSSRKTSGIQERLRSDLSKNSETRCLDSSV
ncbi:MAG: exodeoxyribonuclease V subunit alpha [Chlamydiota bacterium]